MDTTVQVCCGVLMWQLWFNLAKPFRYQGSDYFTSVCSVIVQTYCCGLYHSLFSPTDINECVGSNACDTNAACHDTDGSYLCWCKSGFQGDGYSCTG